MKQVLCFALSGLAATGLAVADIDYSPPPVGTQVTWVTETDQGSETRVSEVVATGPDFAIYLYDLGWDANDPTSYFAEFSGLHLKACAADMPSLVERQKLRGFWPLQSGRSIDVSGGEGATYIVGDALEYAVSQMDGPKPAQKVTAVFGDLRTDVTLSLEWHTPVSIGWQDGSGVTAIEVFSPLFAKPASEDEVSVLGNCASLLTGAIN